MSSVGTQPSIGTALVVSTDASAIAQVSESLRQLAMSAEVYAESAQALQVLARRKFEAVLVDLRLGEGATRVLEQVRLSSSNRTAVTFAISASKEEAGAAFKSGSTFVLQRPLTPEAVSLMLKASYGMIVREKRRYFRYPVVVPATIEPREEPQLSGETVNISECGIALSLPVQLKAGVEGTVQFALPDFESPVKAESRVCWSNEKGQAGFLFLSLPAEQALELQEWLSRKLEQQLPESVAEKFRRTRGTS